MAGENENLEELHKDELVERAKEQGIPHASSMRKDELVEALQRGGGGGGGNRERESRGGGNREHESRGGESRSRGGNDDSDRPVGKSHGIKPGENPRPGVRDD